ncbi:MAG: preprotein translocase subunit SecE [Solirubrobacterales bacterium]
MARDRKRAKQRRVRRGTTAGGRVEAAPPSQPVRADLPGALDHASGEVDEFDAALIRGAGGVAATPETDSETSPEVVPEDGAEDDRSAAGTAREEGGPPQAVVGQQVQETGSGRGGNGADGGGGDGGTGGDEAGAGAPAPGAPLRGGNRAVAFLRASWAELQRVQWPDRRQVTQATAVVLGFVAIAGAYLGLADYVAKEIVEFVL